MLASLSYTAGGKNWQRCTKVRRFGNRVHKWGDKWRRRVLETQRQTAIPNSLPPNCESRG